MDGQIVINTKLNDKPLVNGIKNIEDVTKNALSSVKRALATVGLTVGVGALLKSVNGLVKSTGELTDSVDKQSQKVGLSRKGYQEWKYILDQNGASVDGLQMSIKTLSTVVDEAERGNKSYAETLARLGVVTRDASGRAKSQEQIFSDVFTALTKVENQTERTALATKLLGRAATELAPALNGGADSVEELRARAYELGVVLDDATIDAGVHMSNAISDLQHSMQSAMARAFSPLLTYVGDIKIAISEKLAPALEGFVSTAVKVGLTTVAVFSYLKAVVLEVGSAISEALAEPIAQLGEFLKGLLNLPIVQATVEFVAEMAGDLWEGLKKGVQTGDWGDFFQSAVGVAQFAVGILATLQLASLSASALFAAIQGALTAGSLFKVGPSGYVAMLSVGLAVVQAMQTGDWDDLASDLIGGLTAALIAGGLTRSPTVGALAFSIAVNFKIGSKIADLFSPSDTKAIENILNAKGGAFSNNSRKVKEIAKKDLGKALLEGMGVGLADIDKIGEEAATALLEAIRLELGIHSPSTEGIQIGNYFIDGILVGLVEMFPSLEGATKDLVKALEKIWGDADPKPVAPAVSDGGGTVAKPKGQIMQGISNYVAEAKREYEDLSGFVQTSVGNMVAGMSQGLGEGIKALTSLWVNQAAVIQGLDDQISDLNDSMTRSYEDLEDAQKDYNRALASGDSTAIRNAKRKLDDQKKLTQGQEKQLTALKEEKKSVEDGSKAWADFGKIMLKALANVLYGLGAELAARAAVALVTFNWGGAAAATAGSVAAFVAGALVDSWAGSYADGGIVPQIAGVPSTGDRHVASVNPGEVILNAAQQTNLASQLAGGGGITINLEAVYGLDSDDVGRAVYRNIKTLQNEGVLNRW